MMKVNTTEEQSSSLSELTVEKRNVLKIIKK